MTQKVGGKGDLHRKVTLSDMVPGEKLTILARRGRCWFCRRRRGDADTQ